MAEPEAQERTPGNVVAEAEMSPDLTIVIPTYNRADLTGDCLRSIMSLRPCHAEIIVVDDGSSDNTLELVQAIAAREPFHDVRCIGSSRNRGPAAARNRGLGMATAPFVQFVDSDDLVLPEGIGVLVKKLQDHPGLDFSYGRVRLVGPDLQPLDRPRVGARFDDRPGGLVGYHWHTMGAIYRRDFLEAVGPWNPLLRGSQDWEFQARVKLASRQSAFVDVDVGLWRQHSGARVGVSSFSPRYTCAVGRATHLIFRNALAAGRADPALRRRLARRALVHAFQLGAFRRAREKRYLLGVAGKVSGRVSLERAVAWLAPTLPSRVERWVLSRTYPAMLD